jgi:hypothetical protein
MPQPTARDLHVDALLTNLSIAYQNLEYIADRIFPLVPVQKQSDRIAKYDQSFWFRDEAKLRAPGTKSARGGFTVDTSETYFCDRYSYGHEIYDEERDNADSVFNLDRDAVEMVTDKMLMRREVAFATDFFTTGKWGADKVGGTDFTQWSDYANSQPLVDLTTWRDDIEGKIGREPNKLIIGKQLWSSLKWHPDLIDTIKYTQRGQVSLELFAALAEIPEVMVGKAIYTTSVEGTAEGSVTYSRIWGKHALLIYVPPRPSLLTPSGGYTFVWQRVPSAIQYIRRFRDEERECDIIEANSYFDQKLTGASAGIFAQNAAA